LFPDPILGSLMPPPLPLPLELLGADDEGRLDCGADVVVEVEGSLLCSVGDGEAVCCRREVTEMTEPLVTSPVGLIEVTTASGLVEPDSETPNPRPVRSDRTSLSRRPT
jgi:hypothetical protein